jgi:branched-chain amino acid transport system ATP-binding protein
MPLLEAENVRHCFGGLVALDRVSFQVTTGQIKAVIGPNGAGKTTLFNIVSGIFPPTAGSIRFNGTAITGLKPYQIAALGISRTFQNPSLFLHMTVLENVMVGRHCRARQGLLGGAIHWPAQQREEQTMRQSALDCLETVGLTAQASALAGALSFGQRRMVELARALATEPRLLLLDEPASGLNTKETSDLAQLIRKIRDRGITLLLVEHDMSLVMDISDDILVLHFGTPIAEGPPSTVQNNEKVVAVYLGSPEPSTTPPVTEPRKALRPTPVEI